MSSDIAIRVTNLSKCYQIYDKPQDRLKQFILPRLQRLAGQQPKQYYREFWALKDVSFEVKKGETVGIIGRNGSGKSTLLQIICGTLNPTCGRVEVNGRVAALLELGAGFNPEFTGRENVYLSASLYGLTREEIDARFDDIAAFADIGEFIDQPVKTYSSGMFVRLAFAVIAHVDADILVVDEALAVGDAFFVQKCMRFLRNFIKHGTLLFVSHDTSAVVNLCSHAILLQHGRIERQGTPKEVTEFYLESLYSEKQETQADYDNTMPEREIIEDEDFYDMRRDIINTSTLRNDIEVFKFDPDSPSFGAGGAKIISVKLLNQDSMPLSWVIGGEMVKLKVTTKVLETLKKPIIGFYIKDRLGQALFGDNTYLTYRECPQQVKTGQTLEAVFEFRMPILPAGDYSICVAIADGTQEEHVQHHWLHDALIIRSHSSSACTGLVGIPMKNITMRVYQEREGGGISGD
jgi:lipopolysaccharide transport system ATP-binding protein